MEIFFWYTERKTRINCILLVRCLYTWVLTHTVDTALPLCKSLIIIHSILAGIWTTDSKSSIKNTSASGFHGERKKKNSGNSEQCNLSVIWVYFSNDPVIYGTQIDNAHPSKRLGALTNPTDCNRLTDWHFWHRVYVNIAFSVRFGWNYEIEKWWWSGACNTYRQNVVSYLFGIHFHSMIHDDTIWRVFFLLHYMQSCFMTAA